MRTKNTAIKVKLVTKTGLKRELIIRVSTNAEAKREALQHYPGAHIESCSDVKIIKRK